MKYIHPSLEAHYEQECTTLARCWKIVRKDGQAFRFTSHDSPVMVDGEEYNAAYGFNSTALDGKSDMTVDSLDVTGIFDDSAITLEDLRAGLFDYSSVYHFAVNWDQRSTAWEVLGTCGAGSGGGAGVANPYYAIRMTLGGAQYIFECDYPWTNTRLINVDTMTIVSSTGDGVTLAGFANFKLAGPHVVDADTAIVYGMSAPLTGGDEPDWDSGTTYATGDIVSRTSNSTKRSYISTQDSNLALDPAAVGATAWTQIDDHVDVYSFTCTVAGVVATKIRTIMMRDVDAAWKAITDRGPIVYDGSDGNVFMRVANGSSHYLVKVDVSDGSFAWNVTVPGLMGNPDYGAVQSDTDDGTFYFASEHLLFKLTTATGSMTSQAFENVDFQLWSSSARCFIYNSASGWHYFTPADGVIHTFEFDTSVVAAPSSFSMTFDRSAGYGYFVCESTAAPGKVNGIHIMDLAMRREVRAVHFTGVTALSTSGLAMLANKNLCMYDPFGSAYIKVGEVTPKLKLRRGVLGECTSTTQGWFKVELRGLTQLLQQQIVEMYQPTCRADLGDTRCAINLGTLTSTGTVASTTDETHFAVTLDTAVGETTSATWFQHGMVIFTSGKNKGHSIDIKSWTPLTGLIETYIMVGYPVQVGDTFSIVPGCNKTLGTCRDRFDNVLNFRGEAYMPGNDAAFWYPDAGN